MEQEEFLTIVVEHFREDEDGLVLGILALTGQGFDKLLFVRDTELLREPKEVGEQFLGLRRWRWGKLGAGHR